MVNLGLSRRTIILLLLLLSVPSAMAQYYASDDTVTEYPNKGTYYHDLFEGRKTASGEIFDQNKFTAAHWRIKLGTYVLVTNSNNGKQVIVKVNDRCPKRGVFDMSHRAAAAIGILGMQPVTIRILPPGYENLWAQQETMFDSVRSRLNHVSPLAEKPAQTTVAEVKSHGDYNLLLGTVGSHSEVFSQTRRLPAAYRDRVNVESLEASDSLRITLDVHTSRHEAEQLVRTLRKTFPKVQIIPAE